MQDRRWGTFGDLFLNSNKGRQIMPLVADGKMTKVIQATLDPANVLTITCAEQAFVVPGVLPGQLVIANPPAMLAGLGIAGCRVSDIDEITINFVNPTAGTLNMSAGVWEFIVVG